MRFNLPAYTDCANLATHKVIRYRSTYAVAADVQAEESRDVSGPVMFKAKNHKQSEQETCLHCNVTAIVVW